MIVTSTARRCDESEPPGVVVPQPRVVAMAPAGGSAGGRGIGPTPGP